MALITETNDNEPIYNLKAVLQETGLKADTLRAWEKRYGVPQPRRTVGKHRLYSQQDLEILRWLVARQSEGFTISRAIELWQRRQESQTSALKSLPAANEGQPGGQLLILRQQWVNACLNFDEQYAQQVLNQAFALYCTEVVCTELLQVAIAEIGLSWQAGNVSVQQEHFATGLASRRLESIINAAPQPTRSERILLVCPPDEHHVLGSLIINVLLRYQGFDVVNLGACVPLASFCTMLLHVRPNLVILSAQQLHTAANLLDLANLLFEHHVPTAYGGRIFNILPALRDHIPGFFLGETIISAQQTVERMLTSPKLDTCWKVTSEAHRDAYSHFRDGCTSISKMLWEKLKCLPVFSYEKFSNINVYLEQRVLAALKLGDMEFLRPDLGWVEVMLIEQDLPPILLNHYLTLYVEVIYVVLDERGKLIADWLSQFLTQPQQYQAVH